MTELSYTLISDGSSDQALIPILTWLLREHLGGVAIQEAWADVRQLSRPPKSLSEKIKQSLDLYPCDLLFIHRDAERETPQGRKAEILSALEETAQSCTVPSAVCVVPVRMQEAWLLIDERALRKAAGNPNGKEPVQLPDIDDLERLPDPKGVLNAVLRDASGLSGRRRRRFPVTRHTHRVAELIDDFAPLRSLPAFQVLEADLLQVIEEQGWALGKSADDL